MSDENTATSGDVHGTSDSSPRTVDLPNLSHRALALSLDNMNNNMGKMASLLAKLCEKPAPDERPQGLKRQSTSAVSDNSDSEPEETSYKSGKRRRYLSPSDDNISLHASDDLDEADDIQMLTECSKATGQKEREIPAKETQFLQDFANSLDQDDATGDKIQQELADIALKRWGKKLSSDKIKNFSDKYKQPQNCPDIKSVKVNPEIWSQLNAKKKKTDLNISNLQQVIRKITFATLQTTNVLIQNPTGLENNKIMAKQVDTVAMLGHVNTQLTQLRRDEIKPSLKAEYSAICSAEVPITSPYLFGDDLAKQLRDAKEASRISHSFASSSKSGPFKGKQQTFNKYDHSSQGPKRDFLWKGQNRHYKKKKPPNTDKK
ncbi:uncharacterized protein [Montipora foliosa]|uniref:uncharacterized protein n=1 Tax=Montipora foliosa TaxID=591990 RepID=UPI0035F0FF0B